MTHIVSLLLTAAVSLSVGAGGTYALMRVSATCAQAPVPQETPSHFFDAPLPSPTGGPRY